MNDGEAKGHSRLVEFTQEIFRALLGINCSYRFLIRIDQTRKARQISRSTRATTDSLASHQHTCTDNFERSRNIEKCA